MMQKPNGASNNRLRRPLAGSFTSRVVLTLVALSAWSLPVADAGGEEEEFVVIKAGRVIPVEGDEIAPGTVVIVDGKIRSIGRDIEYPKNATVIDARSETVMPGWLHIRSRWELPGYSRNGVHGDLSTRSEYYPSDDQFEDLLEHGFALVALYPDGAGAPGRAMVVKTGGPVDERIVESPSYLRVTFRKMPSDKTTLRDAFKKAKSEIEKVETARKEFEEKQKKAEAEAKEKKEQPKPEENEDKDQGEDNGKKEGDGETPQTQPAASQPAKPKFEPPKIDPAHQVFVDLIQEKEGVFALVEIPSPSNLLHFDDAIEKFEFAHRFLLSNTRWYTDLGRVADKLGERKAQVAMYPNINRLPYTAKRTNLPALLADKGCDVSLIPTADSVSALRAFGQRLAELARSGMKREDVLAGVTLAPARLLGIDAKYGSIEKDKMAYITFFDRDPLDPLAKVTRVMIDAKIVYKAEDGNQ